MFTSEEFVENLNDPEGLTAQAISMLQDVMTYEDSLGLPTEQTFYNGVMSWLMYSARFHMMLKKFLPYLDSYGDLKISIQVIEKFFKLLVKSPMLH